MSGERFLDFPILIILLLLSLKHLSVLLLLSASYFFLCYSLLKCLLWYSVGFNFFPHSIDLLFFLLDSLLQQISLHFCFLPFFFSYSLSQFEHFDSILLLLLFWFWLGFSLLLFLAFLCLLPRRNSSWLILIFFIDFRNNTSFFFFTWLFGRLWALFDVFACFWDFFFFNLFSLTALLYDR